MKKLIVYILVTFSSLNAFGQDDKIPSNLQGIKIVKSNAKLDAQFREASDQISQALDVHRCLKRIKNDANGEIASLRALNPFMVPGVDASKLMIGGFTTDAAPAFKFQYSSPTKCIGVSQIDEITAVAKNALSFRVVYLASDSGETANYWFVVQKQEGGEWKILKFVSTKYFL